jgi:hypothetical protein
MAGKIIQYTPMVFNLKNGYMMYNNITKPIASCAWGLITKEQKDEFVVLYGSEEAAEKGITEEILSAEHKASFYKGTNLMALMWAGNEWSEDGTCFRTLGCVTTKAMRRHWISFAKHSIDMCEAFMLHEPKNVSDIYVAIQSSYKQSCEWAKRMCGFCQIGSAVVNGESFEIYKHNLFNGEEK